MTLKRKIILLILARLLLSFYTLIVEKLAIRNRIIRTLEPINTIVISRITIIYINKNIKLTLILFI